MSQAQFVEPSVAVEPQVGQAGAAESTEVTPDVNSLPEWAREALKKANDQAAKSRIDKRELQEAKAAQAELTALKEAQKTEAQKIQERAENAEREAQAARDELSRERIARRYKIDDDDLDLLGTGTEEQIEARAKRIAAKNAAIAEREATAPPSEKPVQKLRPGATSTDRDISAPDAYPSSWRTAKTAQTRKE